jgi:hypothetical protein
MSFFDSIPQPPLPPKLARSRRPAWQQPDAVIPAWIPGELVLIRTGQAAVAIGGIGVYPNGFEFTVHVRMRGGNESGWHDPFDRHAPRGGQPSADALRLGLLYADGRRGAAADSHRPLDEDAEPGRLIIDHQNSSGSDQRWDGLLWVHPLPPDGPVTFVASWPAYEVGESQAEVDGAAIRAAAARAIILWPEEPENDLGA